MLGAACTRTSPVSCCNTRLNKAYEFAAAHPTHWSSPAAGRATSGLPRVTPCGTTLLPRGPEPARVVSEGRSTSTEENFASLAILRQHGYDETTPIVYVSNAFHCYRAGKYAAMAGFTNATELAAYFRCAAYYRATCGEALALLLLGIQDFRHRANACYGRFAGYE